MWGKGISNGGRGRGLGIKKANFVGRGDGTRGKRTRVRVSWVNRCNGWRKDQEEGGGRGVQKKVIL